MTRIRRFTTTGLTALVALGATACAGGRAEPDAPGEATAAVAPGAAAAVAAQPPAGATPDTAPCADAMTQLDISTCWGREATNAEARASTVRDSALAHLAAREQPDVAQALAAADTAWGGWRDRYCAAIEGRATGGSIGPADKAVCRAMLAREWATQIRRDFLTEGG